MTLDLSGTERGDGYNREQQLGRRMGAWLDELALAGALSPDEARSVRMEIVPVPPSPVADHAPHKRIGEKPFYQCSVDLQSWPCWLIAKACRYGEAFL